MRLGLYRLYLVELLYDVFCDVSWEIANLVCLLHGRKKPKLKSFFYMDLAAQTFIFFTPKHEQKKKLEDNPSFCLWKKGDKIHQRLKIM